mmetsp:Transcript_11308/g.28587  ORF Transcript_11308/g.28587 Transcript_11308/m.28587 type:complete len:259 (-) Transcript_11308:308-1084(-)|eukprot:CAMPEP_0116103028 /NCGR_PEP_ID=MMETSP0327-20121206/13665_1 /TAXON_ID=44447 /ORGANISM="Pseudo-nitzschia delicatissima, Strain B596" /LENGTH=258 /DNA_ID=CAMNT_0003595109 /DNA_START=27 /DNA_END=803 /DNA_ORIENTATION=+
MISGRNVRYARYARSARSAGNAVLLAVFLYAVCAGSLFLSYSSSDSKYSPLDNDGTSRKVRLLKVGKGSKTGQHADITFTATLEAPIEVPLSDIEQGVTLLIPKVETEISSTIKFSVAFEALKNALIDGGLTSSLVGVSKDPKVKAKNVSCKSSKSGRTLKGSKGRKAGCKVVSTTLEGLGKVKVHVTPFETGCSAVEENACYKLEAAITILFSYADVTDVVTDVVAGSTMADLIKTSFEDAGISTDNVVIAEVIVVV